MHGKAYRQAWTAHDSVYDAILALTASYNGRTPALEELRLLAVLSEELDRWQERIRIHRGRPLPSSRADQERRRAKARERKPERGRGLPSGPRAPKDEASESEHPSDPSPEGASEAS